MAVGDWVPCVGYGGGGLSTLNPLNGFLEQEYILVQTGDDQGLVGEVAVVETQSEVLTKRVVGWVTFRASLLIDNDILIHERIRVGLLSDEGDLSFFADDLNDASQANEPFLWERVSQIRTTAGDSFLWPQPDVGHPGWSQIDVRVARRLQRHEVLVYSCQVSSLFGESPFDPGDIFRVIPFLRTWARALG